MRGNWRLPPDTGCHGNDVSQVPWQHFIDQVERGLGLVVVVDNGYYGNEYVHLHVIIDLFFFCYTMVAVTPNESQLSHIGKPRSAVTE